MCGFIIVLGFIKKLLHNHILVLFTLDPKYLQVI